jgi:uncharacterized repeat protein (TIGR03803 family)
MRSTTVPAACAAALICAFSASPALAAKESIIYSFTGGADGGFPQGGVIADASGNFYGATTSDGTGHNGVVYELSPPAKGQKSWTQTTLYNFTGGNDGGVPQAGLMLSKKGALYGTTYAGGANGDGVVFELTPPASGKTAWKEKVLWTFTGGNDGNEPSGVLIEDKAGNLYGTTTGGGTGVVGTVFELSPPAKGQTAWTETVLYNFTGNNDGGEPFGRMLFGSDGNLYGTSAGYGQYNYGTIYRLIAPTGGSGSWTFALLHAFAGGKDGAAPRDGLIQGSDGTLYGTSAGFADDYGNVYLLQTDGSGYQVIYNIPGGTGFSGNGPWQTVSMGANGVLYGTTFGLGANASGTVFKVNPPAAGSTKWTHNVLYTFSPGAGGQFPYSTVLVGTGYVYGTTYGSAGESGFFPGTVWSIKQ